MYKYIHTHPCIYLSCAVYQSETHVEYEKSKYPSSGVCLCVWNAINCIPFVAETAHEIPYVFCVSYGMYRKIGSIISK